MKSFSRNLSREAAAVMIVCLSAGMVRAQAGNQPAAEIATADIHLALCASGPQPHLVWVSGSGGLNLRNRTPESLPATVEINGAHEVVTWQHKPELDTIEPRHVVFVYASAHPYLQLRWEWQARAEFGPVEHRIAIKNLGNQEVRLPMVDSLRLDWSVPVGDELRNFYVEKGADNPSPQGTHLEPMTEGYHWTGTSSTYAHPLIGAPREIIPAEIVFSPTERQAGWYTGIEFSGRTRIRLERSGSSAESVEFGTGVSERRR